MLVCSHGHSRTEPGKREVKNEPSNAAKLALFCPAPGPGPSMFELQALAAQSLRTCLLYDLRRHGLAAHRIARCSCLCVTPKTRLMPPCKAPVLWIPLCLLNPLASRLWLASCHLVVTSIRALERFPSLCCHAGTPLWAYLDISFLQRHSRLQLEAAFQLSAGNLFQSLNYVAGLCHCRYYFPDSRAVLHHPDSVY